ncbi:endonuclease/exonuclease/phosphatase family protein [Lederbergia sp. NSJ-179]|uniref:endonuclease/exonuclease/phosphatase family protein n=1 Tax=Lederbergia sp. NSJ-179 TaxID=2931402 RepID=UPI001FD0F95A|nr:endonuclease/exonuclease/phosphatase family protein [Lederbergia sp. NSJ-179]MCJ7841356.1 endonuclease/exonuclease/phosphatase family protein [Lederbergia sp. NSJ-179]
MKKILKLLLFVVTGLFVILNGLLPSIGFAAENKNQSTLVNVKAMTFNLRYKNNKDSSPHTWNERVPAIRKLISMEKPDIIGTQELLNKQLQDLRNTLPEYNLIGGTHGKHSAIFYKKNNYNILEYDYFWLSDTPEVVGSKTWGNNNPRMVTWAKFLDKKSNKPFYFVNTHFDHRSANAREKSAELILKVTKQFDPKLPVILTGDFNAAPNSLPHQTLTTDGEFVDLWEAAKTRTNEDFGTFNNFKDPTGNGPNKRIDWILGKGNLTTNEIKIVNYQKNGQFPSDHFPVLADISLTYKK